MPAPAGVLRNVTSKPPPVIAHPAATVILLREARNGYETLLVRRNVQLSFHGGAWVFPGGRIDHEDYAAAGDPDDIVAAGRHAAVREAWEEAGIRISHHDLQLFSRWVTPEEAPKRFDTLFFVARASTDRVRVDGGEIHEHRWLRPQEALALQQPGEFDLPPPTFVTLCQLAEHRTVADILAAPPLGPLDPFVPRLYLIPEGACSVYPGDVAYESGSIDQPGPRHRLWMTGSGWRYERTAAESNLAGGDAS
jgi:8-oxo-dGTP pyrophosphatase MutT (NUDIX family)